MKGFTNIAAACAAEHKGKTVRIGRNVVVLSDVHQVGDKMILSTGARTVTLAKFDVVRIWSAETRVAYCGQVMRCSKESFGPSVSVAAAALAGYVGTYVFPAGSWAGPHRILAARVGGDRVVLTVSEDEYIVDLFYRLDVEQTIATRAI